ncbi:ATP-dependent DNA helicase PIF1-like protein [Tanacetum coccineum]
MKARPDLWFSNFLLRVGDGVEEFPGEEKVYSSFDEAKDDTRNFYPLEFLNSLNVSGFPPHYLRLKTRCPIILLRNLDPANGLCNGTRLVCKRFDPNVINAEIVVGQHARVRGQTIPNVGVYLPDLVFSHGQLYVVLSRGISRTTTKDLPDDFIRYNALRLLLTVLTKCLDPSSDASISRAHLRAE